MPIVGFNFDRVLVEKNTKIDEKTKIQVKHNILITNLVEEKLPTGKSKADGLKFDFKFSLDYEPNIGKIELSGFIYYLDDHEILKNILKTWKKDKSLPQELTAMIINTVSIKGNIKALSLSQEVNLPPHIPLPTMNAKASSESYIG